MKKAEIKEKVGTSLLPGRPAFFLLVTQHSMKNDSKVTTWIIFQILDPVIGHIYATCRLQHETKFSKLLVILFTI